MKQSAHRVLMLVENTFPGDNRVRNEAYTLARNGYRVSVIALRAPNELKHEILDGISIFRVPRLTLFEKLPGERRSWLTKIVNKVQIVVGYLAEYCYFTTMCLGVSIYVALTDGIDVIHAHNPPDTLFAVGVVHKLFGTKFVFDHHDLSPELYQSRYNTPSGFVSTVLRLFERWSVKLADMSIATNESYRQIAIDRDGAARGKVFVVRNGPDLSRVSAVAPDPSIVGRGRIILGYVGAMNPQDGLDYLLRSLAHLRFNLKRTDFFCVLVGSGDSLEVLRAETRRLGLADQVMFTGWVPDTEMIRCLSSSDICLDPNPSSPLNDVSTWIKVMEYMALGKPVVSFGLKETRVSAGEAAIFVTPNDEAEFAEAIQQLMDDPERRHQMGEWGRQRVLNALSWDVSAKRLLAAYSFLFGGPDAEQSAPNALQAQIPAGAAVAVPSRLAERRARDLSVHR